MSADQEPSGPSGSRRLLLTFRLDQEQRQRLRSRLAREGRTMSEVVTHGLRQYVQRARHPDGASRPGAKPPASDPGGLVLPDRVAREMAANDFARGLLRQTV